MSRFKKGEITKEALEVIMYDLQCLELKEESLSNEYHYNLLKGNLKDIFGVED